MIKCLYDQHCQQWFSELFAISKLETYCIFKSSFQFEKYLSCVKNTKHRIAITRFRCSAHTLLIEQGRHRNIDRNLRICVKCNMNCIETEYHFLLVCPYYRNIRKECLPMYYCHWPNVNKFKLIMKNEQCGLINKLAKYVYLANTHRT